MPAVEACLDLALALALSGDELSPLVADGHDLINAETDVLVILQPGPGDTARASALQLLESVTEAASAPALPRLIPEPFRAVTAVLRNRLSRAASRAVLRALLNACPVGRNRALAMEADGRAAVAALPAAADTCPVRVLAALGGRAASPGMLLEMASIDAVGKLRCVLQADCGAR